MLKSKIVITLLLVVVVLCICFMFSYRSVWWSFIDVFCLFMAAFLQLMALTLGAKIPDVRKKFSLIAGIFAVLGIVAFIVEAFVWYNIF